jgi:hypothetical protein
MNAFRIERRISAAHVHFGRSICMPKKPDLHIEAISNGLGGPSMYMLWLAGQRKIPATLSITADTGAEQDRVWSNGRRTSAAEFYQEVVVPMASEWGIATAFVRACDKSGTPMPSLWEHTEQMIEAGKLNHIKMPLFGSEGGRLVQMCTSRWKIAAIRQELRRRGATTARNAQGLHALEIGRMRGANYRKEGGFCTWNDVEGERNGKPTRIVKWSSHYYPLIDFGLDRNDIQHELMRLGIPYLVTSECDFCPHQDAPRWLRTDQEMLVRIDALERRMQGQFFFTKQGAQTGRHVLQVVEAFRYQPELMEEDVPTFGCSSVDAVCGM